MRRGDKSFFVKKNLLVALHSILVMIFAICTLVVYYDGIENIYNGVLRVACIILFCEGVALVLNKGNCPLEHWHRRAGDDKGFFDRFFPARTVPYIIPAFSFIVAIGFLVLYI